MNRTSFAGALVAVALGSVLAFAVQSTPKDLDLHVVGLIILLAGLADLAIRFTIADSPLLSTRTAAVAAVVEPLGEPVLDVFGNPITPVAAPRDLDPAAYAPGPAAAPVPAIVPTLEEPLYVEEPQPLVDLGPGGPVPDPEELGFSEEEARDRAMAHARARDQALYEQAVAAAGDGEIPPAYAVPATTPGRLRPRRRR